MLKFNLKKPYIILGSYTMKRYFVTSICVLMLCALALCVFGTSSFYTKYDGSYLILLPDNKTNGDLAYALSGTVYTDSNLTQKATDSEIVGTGKYFSVSQKKYEIIVVGDSDGDGLVSSDDISVAKRAFWKNSLSNREMHIFDADENGRYSSRDYIMLKLHMLEIVKLADDYQAPSVSSSTEPSSEESIDPDWINQCTVNLSDGKTTIQGSGATVSGNVVNITAGGEYTVKGKLSDGMIQVNSAEKVKIRLEGADISNNNGPAILFANADKAFITIANGTVNRLSDGASYSNGKGTVFSEAELEIKGKGTLYITANYRHGICCDDDLSVENGIIIVEKAVKDGIHAKKSITVSGGEIVIKNCAGDAIDCEGTSSGAKGDVYVTGGKITVSGTAGDGINALGNIAFSGGTVNVSCGADAVKTDTQVYVSGNAILTLDAGSDGINSKKGINVSAGNVKIDAIEYTLKSDTNINVTGGKLKLQDVKEKIYALGTVNIADGTIN